MRRILTTLCLFLTCFLDTGAQQTEKIIKGLVTDNEKGTPVAGCNIVIYSGRKSIGTVSESNGYFQIGLWEDPEISQLTITFSHINYHTKTMVLSSGNELKIRLDKKVHALQDVVVHSAYNTGNRGNKFVYTPLQAASSISIIGEPDVIRHISSLPGVAQGIEGTLGLFVRGSNNGSNRIEFNGVPFYSYSHLLGMFSAFSPDVIEKTTFRPGGIPAQSGNLSSSLLQISTKKMMGTPLTGNISVSPYMTGAYVAVPLKEDKLSVQVAARTSFMPFLINRAMEFDSSSDEEEDEQAKMKGQVLDLTTIVDWKINEQNSMDLMFYTSNDYFDFEYDYNQNRINWSSLALKAGWSSNLSSKLILQSSAYYSSTYTAQEQIYFDNYQSDKRKSELRLGSELDEWSLNSNIKFDLTDRLNLKTGFTFQSQRFKPASEKTVYTQDIDNKFNDLQHSKLIAAFVEAHYNIPEVLELQLGYRHTLQEMEGQARNNFDIRFLSDIYLSKKLGIEISYDRLTQFYHILEGLPTGWSLNVMIPSSAYFPEEVTRQFYGGVFAKPRFHSFDLHFTIGGYYRQVKNLVSYISTVNMFGIKDATWADEIDTGKGNSYGLEFAASAQGERFGTTLAYTLSKTERTFPQINNGKTFPFKFDRRHILNLQSKYTVAKNKSKKGVKRKQVINAVVAYSTGHNSTLPVASYQGVMPPYWNIRNPGWNFPDQVDDNAFHRQEMTSRNGFKMKDYFRMDLAYTFIKYRPKSTRELSFSIFNVLNRHNPYLVFYEDDKWQQLSIAPVMPSVRWSCRF